MFYGDGTEFPKQFEAIQHLLKVFPDDLFGHAWLAHWYEERASNSKAVAPSEIGADELRQQLIADEQQVLDHTHTVYEAIKAAYDGNIPHSPVPDTNPIPPKSTRS